MLMVYIPRIWKLWRSAKVLFWPCVVAADTASFTGEAGHTELHNQDV